MVVQSTLVHLEWFVLLNLKTWFERHQESSIMVGTTNSGTFCNEQKAGMNVALNKVSKLIFVHELQITKLLVSHFLPETKSLSKTIDSFLNMPYSVGFDNVHFDLDRWWCDQHRASSSWMSALRKALVISMLDHVVSAEHARLSINRKKWSIQIW